MRERTLPRLRLLVILHTSLTAVGCRSDGAPRADRSDEVPRTPKVLLIGIDGVRPDVLAEVPTPRIDSLAAAGFLIEAARTTTPSVSGPSWSSMLTGVWPDKHGVTDNDFTGKRYRDYPDFLTRLEQLRPELSTAAIADWLPLVVADDGFPTVSEEIDVKHALDGYELGWAEADERSVELAVELLASGDPDAVFVYLGNPDETSHQHGSIGTEYREAIALADEHVGRIVRALRARPTYAAEDWLVVSSTDHGRREDGGHGGDSPEEMTIFIVASGPSMAGVAVPDSAYIVDVAPTALAHLGVQPSVEWELDGRALQER
jgi:predicted AlkP superfamily pyrophosphatase or phosphodiesterase